MIIYEVHLQIYLQLLENWRNVTVEYNCPSEKVQNQFILV